MNLNFAGQFPMWGWQWLLLGLIPPAIVLLYFLKLRREPLEVPSTYLWRKAIEDLHVNSLWQRLRRNLLLFLQLLIVLLIILACFRPSWKGTTLSGNRFIFMIDTSASMSAEDVEPTRLDAAKRQVAEMIRTRLKSGDAGMLITFSDRARVEQPFTTNHGLLAQSVEAVRPTQRGSDITEALRVADGLANPDRGSDAISGEVADESELAANVFVFTDGQLRTTPDFSWGNLQPNYIAIGTPGVENVAITAVGVSRNPLRPDQMQAIVQVENFGVSDANVEIGLFFKDATVKSSGEPLLLDAAEVALKPGEKGGTEFTFDTVDEGTMEVRVNYPDALPLDNTAYVAINAAQQTNVLLVTPGNDVLAAALQTPDSMRLCKLTELTPDALSSEKYREDAGKGTYDLIIYDQCAPSEMPRANTVFFGLVPPHTGWSFGEEQTRLQIVDVDPTHPLMKYLNFGDVQLIGFGHSVNAPSGRAVLFDSDVGPLCVIAPRDGFEDLVLGFGILRFEDGQAMVNTDWPRRLSFPLFIKNVLEYLGGSGQLDSLVNVQPGRTVPLRTPVPFDEVMVVDPAGERIRVPRGRDNIYAFNRADSVGVYSFTGADEATHRFAVNLFDPIESNLQPRSELETTWSTVDARQDWEPTRREAWKLLIAFALAVTLGEWYIYNRRVYI